MSRMGEKIKRERIKQGLTPKQLSKKCGISESYILDVEMGKKIISEKVLAQISKVLGVNLEETETLAPQKEQNTEEKRMPSVKIQSQKRQEIYPLDKWEEALSNIIKKVPVYDINMKEIKGYRSFPIINKKVEGFHPDKLIYIEVPDDHLRGYRIHKGDKILLYLNHELVDQSIVLAEYDDMRRLCKINKTDDNRLQLLPCYEDKKAVIKYKKDVKIIGRGIRVEVELKHA